jgi:hypothetical protein
VTSFLNQDTLSIRNAELQSALGARAAEGNEAAQTQVCHIFQMADHFFSILGIIPRLNPG